MCANLLRSHIRICILQAVFGGALAINGGSGQFANADGVVR